MDQFKQYIALFQHLLKSDDDSAACLVAPWAEAEWQQFLGFLHEHRLREFFWYSIERLALLEQAVPAFVQKKLARYATRCRERIAALNRLREEAGDTLSNDGIRWMILKGSALTARFYPPGQLRHQGDVDLLVREEDIPAAVRSLRAAGLQLRGNRSAIRPGRIRAEHAATLSREKLSIDLHWRLRSGPNYGISMDEVWATRQPCAEINGPLETISDEYLLVLLCLSVAHDLGRGGIRLKTFLDLYHVLQQLGEQLESGEFWKRRRSERIAPIFRSALSVAAQILPAAVPPLPAVDAESHLLPFQQSAVEPAGSSPQRQLQLVANPRGAVDNFLWLAQQQQLWKPLHLKWYLARQLHHPGRIPLAIWRMLCFGARLAPWAVSRTSAGVLSQNQTAPAAVENRRAA